MSQDNFEISVMCPRCAERGVPDSLLVERENTKSGETFLGCPLYPRCHYTQELPTWVVMERAGAPKLPGFDL